MMGSLATVLAAKKIRTPEDSFRADVEGDIENVSGILKITQIRVTYHLKIPSEKVEQAQEAFAAYLTSCPAAQSLIGCIAIRDHLELEQTA
jgi:organic hydroperoxide reductase OsmC/OhrA